MKRFLLIALCLLSINTISSAQDAGKQDRVNQKLIDQNVLEAKFFAGLVAHYEEAVASNDVKTATAAKLKISEAMDREIKQTEKVLEKEAARQKKNEAKETADLNTNRNKVNSNAQRLESQKKIVTTFKMVDPLTAKEKEETMRKVVLLLKAFEKTMQ